MSDSRVSGKRATSATKSDAKTANTTTTTSLSSNTKSTKDLYKLDLPPEANLQTLDATKTVINQVNNILKFLILYCFKKFISIKIFSLYY